MRCSKRSIQLSICRCMCTNIREVFLQRARHSYTCRGHARAPTRNTFLHDFETRCACVYTLPQPCAVIASITTQVSMALRGISLNQTIHKHNCGLNLCAHKQPLRGCVRTHCNCVYTRSRAGIGVGAEGYSYSGALGCWIFSSATCEHFLE